MQLELLDEQIFRSATLMSNIKQLLQPWRTATMPATISIISVLKFLHSTIILVFRDKFVILMLQVLYSTILSQLI